MGFRGFQRLGLAVFPGAVLWDAAGVRNDLHDNSSCLLQDCARAIRGCLRRTLWNKEESCASCRRVIISRGSLFCVMAGITIASRLSSPTSVHPHVYSARHISGSLRSPASGFQGFQVWGFATLGLWSSHTPKDPFLNPNPESEP